MNVVLIKILSHTHIFLYNFFSVPHPRKKKVNHQPEKNPAEKFNTFWEEVGQSANGCFDTECEDTVQLLCQLKAENNKLKVENAKLRAENHTLKITLQKHTSHNLSRKLKRKDHSTNSWKEKYRKIKKDSTSRNILSLRKTIKDLKTNNKSLKRKTTAAKRKKVQLKSSTLLQK